MIKVHVVPPPAEDIPRIASTEQAYTLDKDFDMNGVPHALMGSLNADFTRLEGAIARLNYVSCHGTITVTVANGKFAFNGELTTYASTLADEVEGILRSIDRMGIAISKAHQGVFRAKFTLQQTMKYLFYRS